LEKTHRCEALLRAAGRLESSKEWLALLLERASILKGMGLVDSALDLHLRVREIIGAPIRLQYMREMCGCLLGAASLLGSKGHFDRSEECLSTCKKWQEAGVPPNHPLVLTTKRQRADCLLLKGDMNRAKETYEAVLQAQGRILEATHPEYITTQNNLA